METLSASEAVQALLIERAELQSKIDDLRKQLQSLTEEA